MRILHVLSQIQITGAETYALALAQACKERGHEIVVVSDALHEPHALKFKALPIHGRNRSYLGRVRNVLALREIIRAEGVNFIHSHSRAANLVVEFAGVPYAATVHGRWRNTFAFRAFPCLGRITLAVCPYLERYLIEKIGLSPERIRMIPNPVDTKRFSPHPNPLPEGEGAHERTGGSDPPLGAHGRTGRSDLPLPLGEGSRRGEGGPIILYVGRFSGQKGKALRFLLKKVVGEVFNLFSDAQFKILADEPAKEDLDMIEGLNGGMNFVKAVEIVSGDTILNSAGIKYGVPRIVDLYRSSTVVVGSGRVVLEALSCGKAVVAIGESSAPGLLREESFEQAFDSNFGDCGEWDLFKGSETRLIQDIEKVLKDAALRSELGSWGRKTVLSRFDAKLLAPEVTRLYEAAIKS